MVTNSYGWFLVVMGGCDWLWVVTSGFGMITCSQEMVTGGYGWFRVVMGGWVVKG